MIAYIQENWDSILAIITSVIAAASAIAAVTPTPKDDNLVKKLYWLVDLFALNIGKAKDK